MSFYFPCILNRENAKYQQTINRTKNREKCVKNKRIFVFFYLYRTKIENAEKTMNWSCNSR